MTNIPITGCRTCEGTAGRLGCPIHTQSMNMKINKELKEKNVCLRGETWYPNHYWGDWNTPKEVTERFYVQFKQCMGCGIAEKRLIDLN